MYVIWVSCWKEGGYASKEISAVFASAGFEDSQRLLGSLLASMWEDEIDGDLFDASAEADTLVDEEVVIIGAVGATLFLAAASIVAEGARIGATGATPVLNLRGPAAEVSLLPSYFFSVSTRNWRDSAARAL
jgi:hypothetical protein